MKIIDILSPISRRKALFIELFILFSLLLGVGATFLPQTEKTTFYFSVKPLRSEKYPDTYSLDSAESTSKVVEMIAGWAKDPGFRQAILAEAEVAIPRFKRKISARKQNRMNVFWTLKLSNEERAHRPALVEAFKKVFAARFEDFNDQQLPRYGTTDIAVFSESSSFPFSYYVIAACFLGLGLSFMGVYIYEVSSRRISFVSQVRDIFPKSPILTLESTPGIEAPLLEPFILRFSVPRLVGTFDSAKNYFSLTAPQEIDRKVDTPIVVIRLGHTKEVDLENLRALFGKKVGVVVYRR